MRIAIIGANGQLAFDLIRVLRNNYELVKFDYKDFDVADRVKTIDSIVRIKPELVINTTAFHNVEECELDVEKSYRVNAIGAWNVARAANQIGASSIYISTDYVFGNEKKSYTESDRPDPLNVYGASKLAGEILTKIANPNYYIIRTSALFGIHRSGKGYNFVTMMLKLANENQEIKVVDDQFISPTSTFDLAIKIKELIEKKVPFGIYHITGRGSASWYEFAKKIFELSGLSPNFKAIKAVDRISRVKRPQSTILENRAIKKLGLEPMRPWLASLEAYLEELNQKELQ
jgi:dTDP-4-dehydrorhamnose reductase